MFNNKIKIFVTLAFAGTLGFSTQSFAKPNIDGSHRPLNKQLLKTAAGCDPATAVIDLDVNNVRARLMTGGDMWWDIGTGTAAYEIPKGTKKNSLFAGSVWVGGFTSDKQLKVCAQTYRQTGNDYWPGPLNNDASGNIVIDAATCSDWDRFWKVDKPTINQFLELYKTSGTAATQTAQFKSIWEWPARGNGNSPRINGNTYMRATGTSGNELDMNDREYAPFVDAGGANNDPELYNPELGDVPGNPDIRQLRGDQYIWWMFNDKGNVKLQSQTASIGMEVQVGAFAYSSNDFMNNATFYDYYLLNRGPSDLDSTYMATWTDADLGYAYDDYVGCDTVRGLGILYNGNPIDGNGEVGSYGTDVPMVGVDFFIGPKKEYTQNGVLKDSLMKMTAFTYFNNSSDARIGNPDNGVQIYYYMTGSSRDGEAFSDDFTGVAGLPTTAIGGGPATHFIFFGDPDKPTWSECYCRNPPGDRRFIHSAGPFKLRSGDRNHVIIGAVWVSSVGGCPNTSFKKIRVADDQAQTLFDNNFKKIEGPEAPRMVVREMNNKLIFYIVNDPVSNNFQEKFGYQTDTAKYRVASGKAKIAKSADSLYKFEGYRVFQLRNSSVDVSQIYDETGAVNTNNAVQVFQCDIHNGISQLVNWNKNIDINACDSCYNPVIKVSGKDSGIVHSFEINTDAFATGINKALVNYRTYYYVAIAYSYNNFANFSPTNSEFTQDVVYLESAHGANQTPIPIVTGMPNPSNGDMGTVLNSDYGTGVIIKRIEGVGNGGNVMQLSPESEAQALDPTTGYQSTQPTYLEGQGPANVKVVDPRKVPGGNWSLYIKADNSLAPPYTLPVLQSVTDKSIRLVNSKAQWVLVKDGTDTVYSEQHLDVLNEQIIEKYGLSVSIKQVLRPGDDQPNGNGNITSDVTFTNPDIPWLAGVQDGEQTSPQNWIRSGNNQDPATNTGTNPHTCDFSDTKFDTLQSYESMFANSTLTKATWAPYSLGFLANPDNPDYACNDGIARPNSTRPLYDLQNVDLVFTSDKSKWSKCVVFEADNDPNLSEGRTAKFMLRSHKSFTGNVDANGNPIYSTTDTGFSYFPGYAINVETGERLNVAFAEDSYLTSDNGRDMIWNPTATIIDNLGNTIFGGRHYVYISNTHYDGCDSLSKLFANSSPLFQANGFKSFIWCGMPTLNPGFKLLPLKDGIIPTEARLRFRVTRPYSYYVPKGVDTNAVGSNKGFPWYTFNTDNLKAKALSDAGNNTNLQSLLDRINAVPNPYYAYSGYEANRLDTRVRIVNLPRKATISIFSLDGSLIRRLEKDDPNTSYIDWDTRNAKGLPIASGMYLIHVKADGIGETILRWFGAMRPVDITTY